MTDRDELLRQIGERVVERADEDGFMDRPCPTCGGYFASVSRRSDMLSHSDDCLLTRYLEATDGDL